MIAEAAPDAAATADEGEGEEGERKRAAFEAQQAFAAMTEESTMPECIPPAWILELPEVKIVELEQAITTIGNTRGTFDLPACNEIARVFGLRGLQVRDFLAHMRYRRRTSTGFVETTASAPGQTTGEAAPDAAQPKPTPYVDVRNTPGFDDAPWHHGRQQLTAQPIARTPLRRFGLARTLCGPDGVLPRDDLSHCERQIVAAQVIVERNCQHLNRGWHW